MEQKRLLIVDDQAEIGQYIKNVAAPLGFQVTVIDNSRDFMRHYVATRPDIIVMDILMPDQDGIELLQELAKVGCKAQLLFISGAEFFLETAAKLAKNAGLENVATLAKPIRAAELRAFLEQTSGMAQAG